MSAKIYTQIAGTGSYLPKRVMTNDELGSRLDTSDEWIRTRTGIHERHIAADDESTVDLAEHAARAALDAAGMDGVDMVIVATTTPDKIFPGTACLLQARLGLSDIPAFDVQAVCSGFVYAMSIADQYIKSGVVKSILVVGSEIMSRIMDWNDRATCILFGDGAGAVVLKVGDEPGIYSTHLHAEGSLENILNVPGGAGSPRTDDDSQDAPSVYMEGANVFKVAARVMDEMVDEALTHNNMQKSDIHWLVPHQANVRIIQAAARKLGLPMDRVVVTIDKHANTSAASIPLALDCAVRDGRIKRGECLFMEGVGAGMTWGSVLVRF